MSGPWQLRTAALEDVAAEFETHRAVAEIVAFIRAGGKRSLCTPRETPGAP